MVDVRVEFENRLKHLDRKHQAMGRGMTASLRGDGLIVVKPKGFRPYLPARGAMFVIVGFLAFKGLMLAALGTEVYNDNVAELQAGSIFEKAGAAIMKVDPASKSISNLLAPLFD